MIDTAVSRLGLPYFLTGWNWIFVSQLEKKKCLLVLPALSCYTILLSISGLFKPSVQHWQIQRAWSMMGDIVKFGSCWNYFWSIVISLRCKNICISFFVNNFGHAAAIQIKIHVWCESGAVYGYFLSLPHKCKNVIFTPNQVLRLMYCNSNQPCTALLIPPALMNEFTIKHSHHIACMSVWL